MNFNNGPSTIDYPLCNNKSYELISDFIVLPMNELSDHSKIVTFYKEGLVVKNGEEKDHYKWKEMGNLYKWGNKRRYFFTINFAIVCREIEEINQRINAGLIHSTGELIEQMYINTAKATLKEKVNKKSLKNWKRSKK